MPLGTESVAGLAKPVVADRSGTRPACWEFARGTTLEVLVRPIARRETRENGTRMLLGASEEFPGNPQRVQLAQYDPGTDPQKNEPRSEVLPTGSVAAAAVVAQGVVGTGEEVADYAGAVHAVSDRTVAAGIHVHIADDVTVAAVQTGVDTGEEVADDVFAHRIVAAQIAECASVVLGRENTGVEEDPASPQPLS